MIRRISENFGLLDFFPESALLERMTVALKTEKRDVFGKRLKSCRRDGKLPAVWYGYGVDTQAIAVPLKDFMKAWKTAGESTIIELDMDNARKSVLIYDVAFDPVTEIPLHVDFYAVRMDKPITATIPLVFTGESLAVKTMGGILVRVIHEIEVEALPKDLPRELTVDISGLAALKDRITIGNIILPDGVKTTADAADTVALVEAPVAEETETAPERSIEDIEVIAKGKKEEEGEEKADGQKEKGGETSTSKK